MAVTSLKESLCLTVVDTCDVGTEGQILRLVAESLSYAVQYFGIGAPSQFVEAIELAKDRGGVLVLCGHGDERGLLFGELSEELYADQPFRTVLKPDEMSELLSLKGLQVLTTACLAGCREFGAAALKAEAEAWIGFDDYPEGDDALFSAMTFLRAFAKSRDTKAAFASAKAASEDGQTMLRLYQPS